MISFNVLMAHVHFIFLFKLTGEKENKSKEEKRKKQPSEEMAKHPTEGSVGLSKLSK